MTSASASDLQLEIAAQFLGRDGAPAYWAYEVVPGDGSLRDVYLFNRTDETRGVVGKLWARGDPTTEIIPWHDVIRVATLLGYSDDIMRFYRTTVESGDVFQLAYGMQERQYRAEKNSFDRSAVGVGYVPGLDGVLDLVEDRVLSWEDAAAARLRFIRPVAARWGLDGGTEAGERVVDTVETAGVERLRAILRYVCGLDEDVEPEELLLREDAVRMLRLCIGRSVTYREQGDYATLLVGASGIGKTRLVEWIRRALGPRCTRIGLEFAERTEPHPALVRGWDRASCLVTDDLHHLQPERLKPLARTGTISGVRGMGENIDHGSGYSAGRSEVEPRYQAWVQMNTGFDRTPALEHVNRMLFVPLRDAQADYSAEVRALLDEAWPDEEVGQALRWCLRADEGMRAGGDAAAEWERDVRGRFQDRYFDRGGGDSMAGAVGSVLERGDRNDWVFLDGVSGLRWVGPLDGYGVEREDKSSRWQTNVWRAVTMVNGQAVREHKQVQHAMRMRLATRGIDVPGRVWRVRGVRVKEEAVAVHGRRLDVGLRWVEALVEEGWSGW